jgi:hypothetical protein
MRSRKVSGIGRRHHESSQNAHETVCGFDGEKRKWTQKFGA